MDGNNVYINTLQGQKSSKNYENQYRVQKKIHYEEEYQKGPLEGINIFLTS